MGIEASHRLPTCNHASKVQSLNPVSLYPVSPTLDPVLSNSYP